MEENNIESKDNLFKEIGEKMYPLFFNRNFGLATKSEIESMLFYSYLKHKINSNSDYSDRTLSRELGISEVKVRNLKRTCYARYEDAIDFPKLLTSLS
ncbi:TPA: PcfX family protein, partial [Enterococcus faecium]|nr:PcfX family protein [Enterococcus faecium]